MTTEPTPEVKSIRYAEGLGLDSVYHEAVSKSNELQSLHQKMLELRGSRRLKEAFKADREMEVTEEVYKLHPTESQAARDRLMKVAFSNDGDIRETKDELATLAGEIDYVEYEIERIHQDIKIAVARLHELSGYYQFMAVVKQASESRKTREAKENLTEDPWRPL